jgi:hypothetical protein
LTRSTDGTLRKGCRFRMASSNKGSPGRMGRTATLGN